jgi:hypothetical protein
MRTNPQLALAFVLLAACSSKTETPTTPLPDAGTTAQPVPSPAPEPPPPPTVQTGPCDATMTLALKTAIEARAKKELSPGMKPEGVFTCQLVAEGGTVQVPVTVQAGKCYAALAHSFPNVTELDLIAKPNLGPNPNPLLAPIATLVFGQDVETGPTASVGGGANCMKHPGGLITIPVAAIAEATAKAGAGPVAVQVYVK